MNMDHSPGDGDGDGSAGSKVSRFFKIISDSGTHRLRLPIEFMRRHGHDLEDHVSVKVPSGLVWKVELIHSGGETWLHSGWRRFEEYYSINVGHFLLFEYVGNSHLEVHVFDTTATEIDYFHYDSIHGDLNQAADEAEGFEPGSDHSVFLKENFTSKDAKGEDTTTVSQCRSEAYTRALAFMSEKPTRKPFSIVVMQPSYVATKYPALNVPTPFAREVLSRRENSLILRVSQGKTWLVRCVYGGLRGYLTTGWPEFVEDNDLKLGDVCVFKVAEKTIDMTWNVAIFRS